MRLDDPKPGQTTVRPSGLLCLARHALRHRALESDVRYHTVVETMVLPTEHDAYLSLTMSAWSTYQ